VLLHVAWADYQVANVASEVQARSYGARLLQTSLDASRHWSDDFEFGFETFGVVDGVVQPHAGSVIVYFDSGNGPFPSVNLPPANIPGESDPHSDPRADQLGGDQRAIFLNDGLVTDPFEGQPYWSQVCPGAANPNCP
jgi:hypothetical protein